MAGLAGLDDLINRITGGAAEAPQNIWFHKSTTLNTSAQYFASPWTVEGVGWGAGAAPTTAAVPTNATAGGALQINPGGGNKLWIASVTAKAPGTGYMVIYDRLLHCGGLSGTSTSPQTVGGTLTRYTDGLGNHVLAEIYTSLGGTNATISGSYTDQDGNPGTLPAAGTNYTFGSGIAQFPSGAMPLPLASGDTGIRALATVTLSITTGSVGDWGVSIIHPLLFVPCCTLNGGYVLDYTEWIPEIATDACLGMYFQRTATPVVVTGNLVLVEA